MNKKNIDWEKWEQENHRKWTEERLKKTKSGSIAFIQDKDQLTNWEIYHTHWEDWLSSSDYWKNWRAKINSFQTKEEVSFYVDRLRAFIDFVKDHTRKNIRYVENAKPWDPINTPKLIGRELKRLENISEEEFKKEDKWINSVEWREMTNEEIADMLEWFPSRKNGEKVNDTIQRKNNDWHANNLITAAAIITFLALAVGLLVKKQYQKKNGPKR